MSWVVSHLIRNRNIIKSNQSNNSNFDDDDYNNLIILESKIKSLHQHEILSDFDLIILDSVNDNVLHDKLKSVIKDRHTLSNSFSQICKKIGFYLGGYFTDEGFLENMRINYKLNDNQLSELRSYMTGKFRNKLKRKNNK